MRASRLLVPFFMVLAGAGAASAADIGLRGPIIEAPPAVAVGGGPDWGGFYIGIMAGAATGSSSLDPAAKGLNGAIMPNPKGGLVYVETPSPVSATKAGFGGFIGYQVPFEDTVIGIEADYLRAALANTAVLPRTGVDAAGPYTQTTTLSRRIDDLVTLRLRAGFTPGTVMFYATGGLAYARGGYDGFVTSTTTAPSGFSTTTTASYSKSASAFGLAYGLGLETMLMNRFLLRAEYIGTKFNNFGGEKADVHTFRAGLGFKFGGGSSSYAEAPVPAGF